MADDGGKSLVSISYSHKDEIWKEAMERPLEAGKSSIQRTRRRQAKNRAAKPISRIPFVTIGGYSSVSSSVVMTINSIVGDDA